MTEQKYSTTPNPKPHVIYSALAEIGIEYVVAKNKWQVGKHLFKFDDFSQALACGIELLQTSQQLKQIICPKTDKPAEGPADEKHD